MVGSLGASVSRTRIELGVYSLNSPGGFSSGLGIGAAAGRLRESNCRERHSGGADGGKNCPSRTGDVFLHSDFGSVSHAGRSSDVEMSRANIWDATARLPPMKF